MGSGFSEVGRDTKSVEAVKPISPLDIPASAGAAPEHVSEEEMEEAIQPKAVPNVVQPTEKEREDHELTHTPFRNWCYHCVVGRGTERNFTASSGPGCIPWFHADYFFMGEKETDGTTPILNIKDDTQKSVFTHVVPEKGCKLFRDTANCS